MTYTVARVVGGVEQSLTAFETAALTFDSADGSLDILSTDYSLDGEVWTIRLICSSDYSTTA